MLRVVNVLPQVQVTSVSGRPENLRDAAASVFVSDEKTEVYLRDQRRSKAHRSLLPDPGAPCDDVLTVDLSAEDEARYERERAHLATVMATFTDLRPDASLQMRVPVPGRSTR